MSTGHQHAWQGLNGPGDYHLYCPCGWSVCVTRNGVESPTALDPDDVAAVLRDAAQVPPIEPHHFLCIVGDARCRPASRDELRRERRRQAAATHERLWSAVMEWADRQPKQLRIIGGEAAERGPNLSGAAGGEGDGDAPPG